MNQEQSQPPPDNGTVEKTETDGKPSDHKKPDTQTVHSAVPDQVEESSVESASTELLPPPMSPKDKSFWLTQASIGIDPLHFQDNPGYVQSLIEKGLQACFICYHGVGSSKRIATEFSNLIETPSTKLSRGLQHLKHLKSTRERIPKNGRAYDQIISILSDIPHLVITLPWDLIRGNNTSESVEDVIADLREKVEEKGHTLYMEADDTAHDFRVWATKRMKRILANSEK